MPTKPYKILAVDDSPQLQALLRAVLTEAGYDLCCAANCRQALALAQSAAPDAILLDVTLPDGDGFSLFERLRRQSDVPVLFLSARDEDEARLRGLGLGADDYITKPFLPQELLLRLAAVLRRVYKGVTPPRRTGSAVLSFSGAEAPCAAPGGRYPDGQGAAASEKAVG